MHSSDILRYAWHSLKGYRARTLLMLLAMCISVASVLLLTALGEGAKRYVMGEFTSLGTHLLIVMPGRSETSGVGVSTMMGVTPRDLTLDDARALMHHPSVARIAPVNVGAVEISWQGRKREISLLGATAEILELRQWKLASGSFLPKTEWGRASPVVVIGRNIRDQIFGAHAAIGQWVRLGNQRYRVIGIMASEGRSLDFDMQNLAIIPVSSAQSLLNTPSLFRILIETESREAMLKVKVFVEQTLQQRHHGEKDITVVTQDAVVQTFDRILNSLTYAVAGIAAISLFVAGILIMNVMLVVVSQRTAEIGLLKALGASRQKILSLILVEALQLSAIGVVTGFIVGLGGSWALRQALPALQAYPPLWAMISSALVALGTGLLFSLLPARKAAALDPVQALQGR